MQAVWDWFSIHSPLAGRDYVLWRYDFICANFQSTRPLRGETFGGRNQAATTDFSIHSPLAGRDACVPENGASMAFFNPLAPCGARRSSLQWTWPAPWFSIHSPLAGRDSVLKQAPPVAGIFNPLAPCGARRMDQGKALQINMFSIHSPLAGRDRRRAWRRERCSFSIHSPLAGRDLSGSDGGSCYFHFQSTRPLRGETANNHENCLQKIFVLHSPLSHKSAKRRLRKKNGLCQQENRHTFGANLPGIWCALAVRNQRISGSSVERTGDTP